MMRFRPSLIREHFTWPGTPPWIWMLRRTWNDGAKLIHNFVRKICRLPGNWTMANFKEEAIARVREQVGAGKVICGLSGACGNFYLSVGLNSKQTEFVQ